MLYIAQTKTMVDVTSDLIGRLCSFPSFNGSLLYGIIVSQTESKVTVRRVIKRRNYKKLVKFYTFSIERVTVYENKAEII